MTGAGSRGRTRDIPLTGRAPYQLSYAGVNVVAKAGFEPATFGV